MTRAPTAVGLPGGPRSTTRRGLVPAAGLPADKELWARLDIRAVEGKDTVPSTADSGISIPALIQSLSRPPRPQQDHWTLESASFHLADLKQ